MKHHTDRFELDAATTSLVVGLAAERADRPSTAALMTIERLRRLEEEVRCSGTTRQTLQKISSARRILGDRVEFGRFTGPFLAG
ncbi:hypothetical protein [Methylobacterium iners]|uniref:Uncharacterized protein n=1 Tax=Methylobacterium iners TaxID=418707 RepID=A0ABQ4S4M0_9HYPH|nr:hypothetical protein [Methylobacterium iners]GJD98078.1 hypothetical protein OCOJLMKI_5317 [Methylobacterium iners]